MDLFLRLKWQLLRRKHGFSIVEFSRVFHIFSLLLTIHIILEINFISYLKVHYPKMPPTQRSQ